MDISFVCQFCQQRLEVDETATGMELPCPNCGKTIVVPQPKSPAVAVRVAMSHPVQPPPATSVSPAMRKCPYCGEDILATAVKCKHCGSMIGGAATVPMLADVSDQELRLFVDKNLDYYLPKWATMVHTGSTVSWNSAAFFGGIPWMAYRKMYLYMWLVLGFCIGEGILEEALQLPALFTWGTNLIVWILFGMYGDTLYLRHAKLRITGIKLRIADTEMQRAQIAKAGGTTWGGVLGILFVILILVVLAAIAQT